MNTRSELDELATRLSSVDSRIKSAAIASGRDPQEIELVVVTKGKSAAVIKQLAELGVKNIGESYLKEALFKQELLRDYEMDWHMIGTIQSGKAKQIIYNFNQIHSVHNLELARELQKWAQEFGKIGQVFLELNVSGEDTKQGWTILGEQGLAGFLSDVDQIREMPDLDVRGLMTMAPYAQDPENSRPYFRKLRETRDLLLERRPDCGMGGLSMGMSGDFEVAVQEGATILRIGSAIVGERQG